MSSTSIPSTKEIMMMQVRWRHHQSGLLSYLRQMLVSELFVDVTLCCQGKRLKAHRVLLSASSPYLQSGAGMKSFLGVDIEANHIHPRCCDTKQVCSYCTAYSQLKRVRLPFCDNYNASVVRCNTALLTLKPIDGAMRTVTTQKGLLNCS